MDDLMTFPDTWEEFEQDYGFTDVEQVYTNGSRLIQSFRVKQWLDHISDETKSETDTISRQVAIDAIRASASKYTGFMEMEMYTDDDAVEAINGVPSAKQWIPCSERLPEEDFWSGRGRQFSDHVFVTIVTHVNEDEQFTFTDMAQTVDGTWQLSHGVDGDCSLPNWCEVIAWMPLPEPYKGEEDEQIH